MRLLRRHAGEPSADDRAALEQLWESLSAHYATGIAHIAGALAREADPSQLGRAVFVDLDRAVKDHPELLERYLLTEAVTPGADVLAGLARGVLDRRDAALRAQGRDARGAALQPGRPGQTRTRRPEPHAGRARRRGRGHAGPGNERAGALASRRGCTSGRSRSSSAQGARLRLVNIQNWDEATWHFSRERAIVGRDASLQWTVGGLGSRLAKVNQEVALAGQGAKAQVNGVMFTTGRQHLAYFTRQDHIAPHTTSDLLYKAGLKDKSRIVWKGMIRVEKDAQRTDAYQKNDNLVLSHSARADSIPGLEIEANDVRCTHGATAGRVDEEMIFYAQARGDSQGDRHSTDRRGLLRQRLRSDHHRSGPRGASPGGRDQARVISAMFSTEPTPWENPTFIRKSSFRPTGSQDHLKDPKVRIVESDEDLLLYGQGHIPGAVMIDWQGDLQDQLVRDYINAEKFAAICSKAGIGNDTTVVFYGDKSNWWACYAFWAFKLFGHADCRILNGGRKLWLDQKRPTSTEVPTIPPRNTRCAAARKSGSASSATRLPLTPRRGSR